MVMYRIYLAERVGFEPTVPLPVRQFSRLLPSTTRSPLLIKQPHRVGFWRRRRDSNSRGKFLPPNDLANRPLQPLGYSSITPVNYNIVYRLSSNFYFLGARAKTTVSTWVVPAFISTFVYASNVESVLQTSSTIKICLSFAKPILGKSKYSP